MDRQTRQTDRSGQTDKQTYRRGKADKEDRQRRQTRQNRQTDTQDTDLFVLICCHRDEGGFLEDDGFLWAVWQAHEVTTPENVEAGLVLVHGVEDVLQHTKGYMPVSTILFRLSN